MVKTTMSGQDSRKKKIFVTAIAILISGLNSSVLRAATIRIPGDQPTIQAGINAAVNGDTVLVSPGTYSESINFNGKKIVLGSLYILIGDTSYISRTVIKGNSSAPVVTFNKNEDSLSVLIGFTVIGGLNGIYCLNSSPTVIYSSIIRNTSSSYGGGIYCSSSSPKLWHLKIANNSANYDGGGVYCTNSHPTLTDIVVSGNSSYGGDGGGLCFSVNSAANVRNALIVNNVAGWYGGGIACLDSNPLLDSSVISGNTSQSWYGGGVYCSNSKPTLTNVSITNNKVYESVGVGSGGGGICCIENSNPFISNVTLARNSAAVAGGGIYVDDNSTITFDSVKRCNIYLNDGVVGYDIYSYTNKLHVVVDTFTVLYPTNMRTFPIANFTFDILHAKLSQDLSTLFVSPNGDNGNSGLSWNEPLKTIKFAKSIISASLQHPATIYIDSGTYSPGTNGELFELDFESYISLKGRGVNKTILKGFGQELILSFGNVVGDTIENLTITNGVSGLGGGVYCVSSSVVFKNVIIRNCTAISDGGGIYSVSSNVTLINTLLFSNRADYWGGALYGMGSRYDLINVTIAGNSAKQYGGCIFCTSTNVNLVNSILWNNSPNQVYFYEQNGPSSINAAYSDVTNGQAGIIVNGNGSVNWIEGTNIEIDPKFINGFHLGDNSACIGAGTEGIQLNGTWFYSPNEDIENNTRPMPSLSLPDLGAFENQLDHPSLVVDKGDKIVNRFMLYQNYPNPFNPSTNIKYSIPKASLVSIKVHDIIGNEIKTLVNEEKAIGIYELTWNASILPSGVYFYRLQAGSFIETKKMILLK